MQVLKHNGDLEELQIDKISKSLQWAGDNLNVSISNVEMACNLHFYNEIPTGEILDVTIKTCKDMVSLKEPGYDTMARNLTLQKVYKQVFESTKPKLFEELLRSNVDNGFYSKALLNFCEDNNAFPFIESCIDNSRDFLFSTSGLDKLNSSYAISSNGKLVESPQHMFMAIAIDIFRDYKSLEKLKTIKQFYDALSTFKISLPTPMMKALRTNSTDYASCVALNIGDSIDSWVEGMGAIIKHTVASAGIGVDLSSVASIGDPVKGGKISHPGKVPVMRAVDAMIQMSSQMGRRGSAVTHTNFFDPEIAEVLSLKSPRTAVENRINDLKHVIKFNEVFYERARDGKDIPLYSTRKFPKLLQLFNSNKIDEFRAYYSLLEELEEPANVINAQELAELFLMERSENGVYYVLNIDEVNSNSPYIFPISQTNICLEFLSRTQPISSEHPNSPDIGICILSNVNQGTTSIEELPAITDLLVRALNNIIHRQVHPTPQANAFIEEYASIGIGFANHAYFLAKNHCKYGSDKGMMLHDQWMEHFQFGLLTASNNIARATKPCIRFFSESTYADGIMPFDRCKSTNLVNRPRECDWTTLSANIKQYGMANIALSMVPPSESSSIVGNMTSGMEPIRDLITIKTQKTGNYSQFAPDALDLAQYYDYAFDRKITKDYLRHVSITQSWIDMSTSANTMYKPELYDNDLIPMSELIEDFFLAKQLGLKTLYYQQTFVEDQNEIEQEGCANGNCSM